MSRTPRSRARQAVAGSIVVAVALSISALAVTPSGAAVGAQAKIDKAAVLKFGAPINDSGGVTFDPSNSALNPYAGMWMDLIYDTMIHRKNLAGDLEPGLATKWTTPDPSTVELTLRDGVKFTDGTPFNAAAVKAAWDRHLVYANTTGSGASTPPETKAITSIETPDDKTVRLHLNQPVAKKLIEEQLITSRWLGVPSPAAAAAGTLNQKPVGAGPMMLQSWAPGQNVVLTNNPNYFDKKSQKLAGMEFHPVAVGAPQISALQTGAVDLIYNPPPDTLPTIQNTKGLAVTSQPGTRVYDMGLCVSKGAFANKTARQALQYAIDRKAINEAAFGGIGTPNPVALTPASPFYNPKLAKSVEYNPKKAKKMLQEAGVAPGTPVQMYVNIDPLQSTMAEVVQSQLKDVGLDAQITRSSNLPSDAARVLPDITNAYVEPSLFSIAFERVSTLNVCNWSSPAFSAAFAVTKDGSKSEVEQQKAWDDLQTILLDESPDILMVAAPNIVAHSNKVKGIDYISATHGPQVDTMYITK